MPIRPGAATIFIFMIYAIIPIFICVLFKESLIYAWGENVRDENDTTSACVFVFEVRPTTEREKEKKNNI